MAEEFVLRVYGGSVSEGMTPEPLVAIGAAPAAFRPSTPTIVDEPQAWMITHAQDYTLYALHTLDGKTADGKDGQLQLCLFFPPQRRLGNGKSPLALLDSIRDLFAVLGMPEGHLPAQPLDNAPFRLVLRNYPLEDRPVLLPVMQGSEAASYCVENSTQLDALMRHSRYDALAKVGRLELGFHCPTTVGLVLGRPGKQSTDENPSPAPKPELKLESKPKPKPNPELESEPRREQQSESIVAQRRAAEQQREGQSNRRFIIVGIILLLLVGLVLLLLPNQSSKAPRVKKTEDVVEDVVAGALAGDDISQQEASIPFEPVQESKTAAKQKKVPLPATKQEPVTDNKAEFPAKKKPVEDIIEIVDDVFVEAESEEGVVDNAIREKALKKEQKKEAKTAAKKEAMEKSEPSGPVDYFKVDVKPYFQGGDQNTFSKWVAQHLQYPEIAKENGIQGKVVLQFTICTDGSVRDVKILRGVDAALNTEAVRVVLSSPKWTPGTMNGKAVNVTYTFPVIFQLK